VALCVLEHRRHPDHAGKTAVEREVQRDTQRLFAGVRDAHVESVEAVGFRPDVPGGLGQVHIVPAARRVVGHRHRLAAAGVRNRDLRRWLGFEKGCIGRDAQVHFQRLPRGQLRRFPAFFLGFGALGEAQACAEAAQVAFGRD